MTLSLFERPRATWDFWADPVQQADPDGLTYYQREAVNRALAKLEEGDRSTLLVMATGLGKCLGRDTPVLMFDGSVKPVQDVVVGDILMGPDSTPRNVLGTSRGVGPLFRIEPTKGEPWVCNWCHVLTLAHTETGEWTDIALDDYLRQSRNYRHLHKLVHAPVDFDVGRSTPLPIDPYILGLWLGDGTKSLASFQVSKPDPEVRDAMLWFAESIGMRLSTYAYDGKCPVYAVVSVDSVGRGGSPLLRTMRELFPDAPVAIRVPYVYRVSSRADRLQLLAGIVDSDGHAGGGCVEVTQLRADLAGDIAFLARSLGFGVTVSPKVVNGTTYTRLVISGDLSIVPCRIARKRLPARRQRKDVLRTGFNVAPTGEGEFFGFTLDGDHRFLLGDFTVTHNTQCFCVLAKEWQQRHGGAVLILAHRTELVYQAKGRLEQLTGANVEVEQAGAWAHDRAPFVVGSVQSFNPKRLERLGKDRFSLVVLDEAHHGCAPIFKRALKWFSDAKVVGVTATPNRADEKALGQVFDSVAYVMGPWEGIEAGFLCPVTGRSLHIDEIDISGVAIDKKKHDLAEGQLDAAILKAGEAIPREVVRLYPGRRAIVFAPGVKSAEYMCAVFNKLEPDCAMFICASTPADQRAELVADFKRGRYTYFVNVGIATEGFDAPDVSMVVMARPTTSEALYAQMAGRGMRANPLVFAVLGADGAAERRNIIRTSPKPDCLLLDCVGNSGKHELKTAEDILGGNYSEDEVRAARKLKEKNPGSDAMENLRKARAQLAAIAASAQAKVKSRVTEFDPFSCYGMEMSEEQRYAVRFGHKAASVGQLMALEHMGMEQEDMKDLSYKAAGALLTMWRARQAASLATFKQVRKLRQFGVDASKASFANARKALDYLAATKWGRNTDMAKLDSILNHYREPGED